MYVRTRLIVCLLASAALSAFAQASLASVNVAEDVIVGRFGTVTHDVKFDVAVGEFVKWNNGEDCGSNGPHHTTKVTPNRYYLHYHISYTLPKTGKDENLNNRTIGLSNITDHWTVVYDGYTKVSGERLDQNCHGYAFDVNTWIDNPSYLDADDYQSASGWGDVKVLRDGSDHSVKVTGASAGYIFWTVTTEERNQQSGAYRNTWTYSSPTNKVTGNSFTKIKPKP